MKNFFVYLQRNKYKTLMALIGAGFYILTPLITERTSTDFLEGLGWIYLFGNIPFGSVLIIIITFILRTIETLELHMGWNMNCSMITPNGDEYCSIHSFGTEWQLPVMGVTGFINLLIVFFLILLVIERMSLYIYRLMTK